MHITHFIQRYPPALGGSEAYFARLSRYLVDCGHSVTVWTSTAIDLEAFWSANGHTLPEETTNEDGVTIKRFGPRHFPMRRYILKALSFLPGRRWQCLAMPCNPISLRMYRESGRTDEPCDVVHASAFPYAFPLVCALRLARQKGVPFLLTPFLHLGARKQYTSPALTWLLHQADRVFVQTPSEQRAVIELGVPIDRVVLQGLGVEPSECTDGDRDGFRREHGIAPGEVVIGHLANQSFEKGTIDLLRAAELAWQRGATFRIVLAGPQMTNFRRFWESFASKDRVISLGVIDEPTKRDFYASIDAFALPSRSDSFGLVLLEAWANGVPNIAYRAGGIADLIRHEQDGLLVPTGDLRELAGGLYRLSKQHELRERLGRCGQERALSEFRWSDKLGIVRRELELATGQIAQTVPVNSDFVRI